MFEVLRPATAARRRQSDTAVMLHPTPGAVAGVCSVRPGGHRCHCETRVDYDKCRRCHVASKVRVTTSLSQKIGTLHAPLALEHLFFQHEEDQIDCKGGRPP